MYARWIFALLLGVACCFLSSGAQFGKKKAKQDSAPAAEVPTNTVSSIPKNYSGKLKVVEASVSQMEDRQARQSDLEFVPGETIFFAVTVDNYKVAPTGRVEINAEMEAFDPQGTSIGPKATEQIKTTILDEDKEWKPKVRAQFQVPSIARPGPYLVRYKVTDVLSSQTLSGEKTFPVVGMNIESSDTLVIRNFGFYRAEEEPAPLAVAAYAPGDTLWARFFITGYKYGPENAMDVAYDVAVLNAEGKEIFAQKNAAVERSKASYPQPWIPGGINLSLQKTMRPGNYAIAVTARDLTGTQTITEKREFRLE